MGCGLFSKCFLVSIISNVCLNGKELKETNNCYLIFLISDRYYTIPLFRSFYQKRMSGKGQSLHDFYYVKFFRFQLQIPIYKGLFCSITARLSPLRPMESVSRRKEWWSLNSLQILQLNDPHYGGLMR